MSHTSETTPAVELNFAANKPDNSEAIAKARGHGWAETADIQYNDLTVSQPAWASDAQVYEFRGDEGEVGPVNEALEQQLFKSEHKTRAGDALAALALTVTQEGPIAIKPVRTFEDAGIHPVVLENVKRCGYKVTTAVQAYCIPAVLSGKDVVAVAQTGSGKTAAYLIPVISKLMGKVKKFQGPRPDVTAVDYDPVAHRVRAEPLVIILVPTRELAQQIFDEARRLCYRSMLRPACAYGGVPVKNNLQELGKGCDLLIATPGRLCDLMDRPRVLSMTRVKYTVLDEADEMLHDDWSQAVEKVMAGGDTNEDADHIYLMFSATFPRSARNIARQYMAQDYVRIRVGRAGSTHKNVKQDIVFVSGDSKREAAYDLLFSRQPCLTLIFCNTVAGVENLDDFLFNKGLPTVFMHSKRTQYEREDAMRSFTSGKNPILISTALSGRGIDFNNVGHVINYDLPSHSQGGIDEYVHRIGRTGRIGHIGLATSFYNERDEELGPDLVNLLLETQQDVPDFLEHLKPEGGQAEFHDDTGDEDEGETGYAVGGVSTGEADATAGAWGGADDTAAAPASADAWGAPATTVAENPVVASW
ncbi:hypothetical protein MBLNU459_g6617t1 [Dothideomycetes sp. NU459]